MPQIKHIAIATQDADATAKFYMEVFGLREIAKLDSPNASGYYLSDGNINLAILDFKNDQVTGPEYGTGFSGIHHIGFEVESLEEIAERLQNASLRKSIASRESNVFLLCVAKVFAPTLKSGVSKILRVPSFNSASTASRIRMPIPAQLLTAANTI